MKAFMWKRGEQKNPLTFDLQTTDILQRNQPHPLEFRGQRPPDAAASPHQSPEQSGALPGWQVAG